MAGDFSSDFGPDFRPVVGPDPRKGMRQALRPGMRQAFVPKMRRVYRYPTSIIPGHKLNIYKETVPDVYAEPNVYATDSDGVEGTLTILGLDVEGSGGTVTVRWQTEAAAHSQVDAAIDAVVITALDTGPASQTAQTITWTTDIEADSEVDYTPG